MDRRIEAYKRYYEGYGEILVQMNVEDTRFGVAEYVLQKYNLDTIERQILELGDLEEGLSAASAVGDDRIQRQATGSVAPESWTHGSSEQRVTWFRRGLDTGRVDQCDTFAALRR